MFAQLIDVSRKMPQSTASQEATWQSHRPAQSMDSEISYFEPSSTSTHNSWVRPSSSDQTSTDLFSSLATSTVGTVSPLWTSFAQRSPRAKILPAPQQRDTHSNRSFFLQLVRSQHDHPLYGRMPLNPALLNVSHNEVLIHSQGRNDTA